MAARRLLSGKTEDFSEINLPDRRFLAKERALLIVAIVVTVALLMSCLCITNTALLFHSKSFYAF